MVSFKDLIPILGSDGESRQRGITLLWISFGIYTIIHIEIWLYNSCFFEVLDGYRFYILVGVAKISMCMDFASQLGLDKNRESLILNAIKLKGTT